MPMGWEGDVWLRLIQPGNQVVRDQCLAVYIMAGTDMNS